MHAFDVSFKESSALNTIQQHNPYGPTSERAVAEFERSIGSKLPESYRRYLLSSNGAEFKNKWFAAFSFGEYNIHPMHEYYRLGQGPDAQRLENAHSLVEVADLSEYSDQLKKFLVFGHTEFDGLLMFDLTDGAVYLFQRDIYFEILDDAEIVKVANSFAAFVSNLMPEDEAEDELVRLEM